VTIHRLSYPKKQSETHCGEVDALRLKSLLQGQQCHAMG
jgi:hypothetical protein